MQNTQTTFPGSIVRDLRPQAGNPRNSEGAFLELRDGTVIFIYSRFKGTDPQDDAPSDLYIIRSTDGGQSFPGEPELVLDCSKENGVNVMSVSLLQMLDNSVGLFYLVKETAALVRLYLRRSSDGGKTWSERVLCTPQQGCFVVNNDRVVRLASGRLIAPAAVHRKGYLVHPDENGPGFMDSRGEAVFFLSDDDGRTWNISSTKCSMPYGANCRSGLQEPGVVEISDGILWGWARTDLGRQFEMFSLDGGNTWTAAQPSMFTSPCSPLSMKFLPDGRLLAVWNPVPEYNGRPKPAAWTGGRNPLVCAVVNLKERTFSNPIPLEDDDTHGYCYVALHPLRDALLLGYCAGGPEDGSTLCATRIRRIEYARLNELLNQ